MTPTMQCIKTGSVSFTFIEISQNQGTQYYDLSLSADPIDPPLIPGLYLVQLVYEMLF